MRYSLLLFSSTELYRVVVVRPQPPAPPHGSDGGCLCSAPVGCHLVDDSPHWGSSCCCAAGGLHRASQRDRSWSTDGLQDADWSCQRTSQQTEASPFRQGDQHPARLSQPSSLAGLSSRSQHGAHGEETLCSEMDQQQLGLKPLHSFQINKIYRRISRSPITIFFQFSSANNFSLK